MITPNEIENKRFKKAGKGYQADEVDDFLDQLTVDYEKLYRTSREQTEQIQTLTKAVEYYQGMENSLNNALVMAEKTAEERKLAAEKQAEQIEKEAHLRAEAILSDAKNRIFGLHQEISQLELQFEKMRARVRMVLEAELTIINRFEADPNREPAQDEGESK